MRWARRMPAIRTSVKFGGPVRAMRSVCARTASQTVSLISQFFNTALAITACHSLTTALSNTRARDEPCFVDCTKMYICPTRCRSHAHVDNYPAGGVECRWVRHVEQSRGERRLSQNRFSKQLGCKIRILENLL